VHIRDQLDIGCRVTGQSVEIFEIRPDWEDKSRTMETPVAKATFVRTRNRWRVLWMRRDLKWHGYEPNLEVQSLDAFLNVVHRDEATLVRHCEVERRSPGYASCATLHTEGPNGSPKGDFKHEVPRMTGHRSGAGKAAAAMRGLPCGGRG
jgi:hypothetical protein